MHLYYRSMATMKTNITLILAMLAWGSVYPVSKYLMSDLHPLVLAFLRYFVAVLALTPFFIIEFRKKRKKIDAKSLLIFIAAGLTGTAVFALFLFLGIEKSTASNGSIIINTQPVFAAILAPILIHESLSRVQVIGIIVGFIGMFVVVTGGNINLFSIDSNMLTGNILLLCGAVSMTLYGIIIKSSVKKYGGMLPTWLSMAAGTIVLFIIAALKVDNFVGIFKTAAVHDTVLILYLGIVATAAAYILFTQSLQHIDVVKATAFKFLIPVSGVGLSVIFLGERPVIAIYAGILIVIFSVLLIQRSPAKTSAA